MVLRSSSQDGLARAAAIRQPAPVAGHPTDRLVGASAAIRSLREQIRQLAAFDAIGSPLVPTLLLQGETGSGKGLVARIVHDSGPRARGPFIEVNCAAIPETLLEAELFGFEPGAFTDARHSKPGLFEAASGGTFFLDEVDALPMRLQGKFLKVIEEKRVRRLGAVADRPVDVKVIAATQSDLAARVAAGRFRADLYHRLAVVVLELPALRERGDDVAMLAEHFLNRYAEGHGLPPKRLGRDAEAWLRRQPWPGNVRELGHLMERATLLCPDARLDADTLERLSLPARRSTPPAAARVEGAPPPEEAERIRDALVRTGGNVARTARLLGITRNALRYRMRRYGLERPRLEDEAPPAASRCASPGRTGSPSGEASCSPSWEQRPLAVLAVDLAFPHAIHLEASRYEPWTAATRWEAAIVDKASAFGGVVLQRAPALLMVVFGIPRALEQLPQRTVQAALAIRHLVTSGAPAGDAEPRPEVRMGIHLGAALVDGQAGDSAVRLLGLGETLSLPVRLLGHAGPGDILVSSQVGRLIDDGFELEARPLPPGPGGADQPGAYAVLGASRGGPEATSGQAASRLVGREREQATLLALLADLEAGRGRVAGIVGEPGMGKSRLLAELRQRTAERGVTYLEGRCFAYGRTIPYLPVVDLLRQHCDVAEADPPEVVAERVRTSLEAAAMAADEAAPFLLRLLGGRAGTERLDALSPEAIKVRTFDALRDLIVRASRQRPLVIVVEDVHWIDSTSEEFVASLARGLAGAPVLLLATYRPGVRPPWMDDADATEIRLEPLSTEDSLCLVRSVFRTDAVAEPIARPILEKAEGNPFFLEELARAVVERGEPTLALAVPATIQEVLMARIDRLPNALRRLLQTASVLGREVPIRLLRGVLEEPADLDRDLRELARLEFLVARTGVEEPVYTFKHALIQDVVYRSLLPTHRQALHAAAGRALERLYTGRLDDVYDRLAYHYSKTTESEKAVTYLVCLADRAVRGHAHAEAVAALEEALVHVERLPSETRDARRLAILLQLAQSFCFLGRFRESLDLLLPEQARVDGLADPALAGPYYAVLGRIYDLLADHDGATRSAERAIVHATRCRDDATMGKAHYVLALEGYWTGKPHLGIEHSRQAVSRLEKTPERYWLGQAYRVLGFNYALIGAFDAALEAEARAEAIGEAIGNPHLSSHATWGAGWIEATRGEWAAGIDACQRGLERSLEPGNAALALGYLGAAYLEHADPARAIDVLEQAVCQVARFGFRRAEGWFTAFLAEACRIGGRLDRARELARRALDISSETRSAPGIAWAQRTLARLAEADGRPHDAERELTAALDTFAAIGASFEVGRTHLALAELSWALGRAPAAARHLSEARRIFDALGVPRYVERAERLARDGGALPAA